MLSSLLRPSKGQRNKRTTRGVFASPFADGSPFGLRRGTARGPRRVAAGYADIDNDDDDDEDEEESDFDQEGDNNGDEEDEDDQQEDDLEEVSDAPLLPIFEASHLDSLPVYSLTHTIRILIVSRCETTLSWEQLRSPQVSQFLVKPIQQAILSSHLSRATIYALMANYLQFSKEAETNPGNSGASKTKAMVSELLAIKLLKEYSTRELIDALSYDFDPLQGNPSKVSVSGQGPNWEAAARARQAQRVARISALEIAIRGQAKRLLAHPVVVQQLEAIWAGTIVFHSAADNLHRRPAKIFPGRGSGYGTINNSGPANSIQSSKQTDILEPSALNTRRSVTLYNPKEASLFKLSRLRVPRYRNFFSTCSLAVLLGLFTAVLAERKTNITTLEVVFWFWSAGFMLDEVVGFNEQGFSLYIMSFWNAFDLGILLILAVYYCLRIACLMTDVDSQRDVALLSYDVLAVNAVLLFPRLFSVLDHFRYFSQLLIAFRMMASDLIAILTLIVIVCSGFFVAFSLGFGNDSFGAGNVVYTLFQLLMGFTPAAWDQWENYNVLGRAMLVLFLFITHFLVVTILITVLTNSFMAIVQNAHDEHQFVFAVNTISMVKSDALFSYIAPTNILAWLLVPLRFMMPLRSFVRLNRTVIKATHFPLLWSIYIYEWAILRTSHFEPTDLIEQRGRKNHEIMALTLGGSGVFSPGNQRLRRERSVATFQKDRALDEVFRRPFKDDTFRPTTKSMERRRKSNVVNDWMSTMGPEGRASPPAEQDLETVDRLETPRHKVNKPLTRGVSGTRAFSSASRSIASDPEDFLNPKPFGISGPHAGHRQALPLRQENISHQTEDVDGDDELLTNDGNDHDNTSLDHRASDKENREHYFQSTPPANTQFRQPLLPLPTTPSTVDREPTITFGESPSRSPRLPSHPSTVKRKPHHVRNLSSNTILYNPVSESQPRGAPPQIKRSSTRDSANFKSAAKFASGSPAKAQQKVRTPPKRTNTGGSRVRPVFPPRGNFKSTPNRSIPGLVLVDSPNHRQKRSALALDLASDLGDNKVAPGGGHAGAVPASFATQMGLAMRGIGRGNMDRELERAHERGMREFNDDQSRMSKLMLARMNELEQGFREVLREVKEWKKGDLWTGSGMSSVTSEIGSSGIGERDFAGSGRRGRAVFRPHTAGAAGAGSESHEGKGKGKSHAQWSEGSELSHDEAQAPSSV